MTKILFLQPDAAEYIGIMSISAVLKQNGFYPEMLLERDTHRIVEFIQSCRPDIVAFPCMTSQAAWVIETSRVIKENHTCLVIVGGPHPTFMPEMVENPYIDAICRGEGEYPMLDLANAFNNGKDITSIPNLWIKYNSRIYRNDVRGLVDDLDKLPFPDRQIYYTQSKFLADSPWKVFITARGCPFLCSFCYNNILFKIYNGKGKYIRRESPLQAIAEIKDVKNRYKLDTVMFADDIFALDKKWLREFLPEYKKEIRLPFNCNIRADLINEAIVIMLKEAGCYSVNFGIESGSERLRQILLKKNVTNKEIVNAAGLLKRYRIKFLTNNMIGLPGETIEEAIETIKLNSKIKTDIPWCSILQPFPNTEIAEYAIKNGYADKKDVEECSRLFFKSSIIKQENINELTNLHKFFILAVKFPWLLPIIKILIRIPSNKFFDFVFLATYFGTYKKRHNVGFVRTFMFGLRFWQYLKD